MKQAIPIFLLAATLTGCLVGPKTDKTRRETNKTYREQQSAQSTDSASMLKWTEVYQDPVLQSLVSTALKQNYDMLTTMAKIDEAGAAAGYSKADLFPSLSYSAGASVLNLNNSQANELGIQQRDLYHGIGVVSWELDIWGKTRHATRSSKAQLLASIESRNAVTSSLVSQVAMLYFKLRGLDERLTIARATLDVRKEGTRIITLRFKGGEVPELDKFQAETQESITAAMVPNIERDVRQTENALSILLGNLPGTIDRGLENREQKIVEIPAGIPSTLLSRRPDVKQAEQLWIAQNERIGVYQAARYPTISLTGALGVASNDLSTLTSGGGIWNLAGGITGPIFAFNKNKRRVEIERAKTEQVRLNYEKTALNAFAEVEDALIAVNTYSREYAARARQVESARGAAALSAQRYDSGYASYMELLDNERTLLNAQLEASATLQQQLQATVMLYKALGGGWQPTN